MSYDEPTFEEVDQHAQALAEIERLREALANEQARGVHTCHEQCQRPMCVMQRAITERDSIIERLRARLAEAERDAARYRYLRQVDRVEPWENLLMLRPIWSSLDIDAAIDAAMAETAPVCPQCNGRTKFKIGDREVWCPICNGAGIDAAMAAT
jgi:hypothetical protein